MAATGAQAGGTTLGDRDVRAALRCSPGLPRLSARQDVVVEADGTALTLRFAGRPWSCGAGPTRAVAKTLALRAVLARYEEAGKALRLHGRLRA